MKRRVFTILMLVLVMGALAVPVVAAEAPDPHTLIADGDGLAMLLGKGSIELSGNGMLWVKVVEGATVEVTGYGEKEVFPDGWQQYAGFHGTAHVEGHRVLVIVAGVDLHLEAAGRGKVFLWGHGTYQQGDSQGTWGTNRLGTSVTLSDGQEATRPNVLRGEVTAVNDDHFILKTRRGQDVTVRVTGDTRYRIPGVENPTLADVQVGDTIVVGGIGQSDDTILAKVIGILRPEPSSP
jgi:hypothetical protein